MGRKQDFIKKISRLMNDSIVSIDPSAIAALKFQEMPTIGQGEATPELCKTPMDVLHFALMVNSINHQFWDVVDGKFSRYSHQGAVGAVAMKKGCEALLAKAGSFEALRGTHIEQSTIEECFGPIPEPEQRGRALEEALGAKGKAAARLMKDAIEEEGIWGIEHAQTISSLLPLGFEDPFLKKSQLCLWMAKGMLESKGFGSPEVELTCFADYQVPKVLRGLGVLKYNERLSKKIDSGCLLEAGGEMEVAIRAATVVACEMISEAKGVSAPQLDFWLWLRRNECKDPFHLVKTRRY